MYVCVCTCILVQCMCVHMHPCTVYVCAHAYMYSVCVCTSILGVCALYTVCVYSICAQDSAMVVYSESYLMTTLSAGVHI